MNRILQICALSLIGLNSIYANANQEVNQNKNVQIEEIEAPYFLKRVHPKYPKQERKLGKNGRVTLIFTINKTTGKAEDIIVQQATTKGFAKSAIKALKQSIFVRTKRKKSILVKNIEEIENISIDATSEYEVVNQKARTVYLFKFK